MTILNFVGFDTGDHAEAALTGSASFLSIVTFNRTGTHSLRVQGTTTTANYVTVLAHGANGIAGGTFNVANLQLSFYFRLTATALGAEMAICDLLDTAGALKLRIAVTTGQVVKVYNSAGTLVSTGSVAMTDQVWYRFDINCGTGSSAAWAWEIHENDYPYTTLDNGNGTSNVGTSNHGSVRIGKTVTTASAAGDYWIDDVFVQGGSSTPEELGQYKVVPIVPSSVTTSGSSWAPNTGTLTTAVATSDGDTTYAVTSTNNALLTGSHGQTFADHGATGSIPCVKAIAIGRDESTTLSWRMGCGGAFALTTAVDGTNAYVLRAAFYTVDAENLDQPFDPTLAPPSVVMQHQQSQVRALRCTHLLLSVLSVPEIPAVDVPPGLVDVIGVTPSTQKTQAVGVGLEKVLGGFQPATLKSAPVQVGVLRVSATSPDSSKSAGAGIGLIELLGLDLASPAQTADVPVGLVEVVALEPATSKVVTPDAGLVKVQAVAPNTVMTTTLDAGPVEVLGIGLTASKSAALDAGPVEVLGVEPSASTASGVGVGLVEVVAIALDTDKLSAAGVGLLEVIALEPATSKVAAVPTGLVEVLGVAPGTTKSAALDAGLVEVLGVAPASGPITAQVEIGLVEVLGVAATTSKSAAVQPGLVDILGIAPDADKVAAADPGLVDILGVELESDSIAQVQSGRVDVLAIELDTDKVAAASVGLVEVSGVAPDANKAAGVGVGLVESTAEICYTLTVTDDAAWDNTSLWDDASSNTLYSVAAFGVIVYKSWYRFTGVEPNATRATLRLRVEVGGVLGARFYCEDADGSSFPLDQIDAASRALTAEFGEYNDVVEASQEVLIDVTDPVVAVTSRPGFDGTLSIIAVSNVLFGGVYVHTEEGAIAPALDVHYASVTTLKSATLSSGPIALLGVEPTTSGLTADIGVGIVGISGVEATTVSAAGVQTGEVAVVGVATTTLKSAEVPIGLVVVAAPLPVPDSHFFVAIVELGRAFTGDEALGAAMLGDVTLATAMLGDGSLAAASEASVTIERAFRSTIDLP